MRSAMELGGSMSRAYVQLRTWAWASNVILADAQIGGYFARMCRAGGSGIAEAPAPADSGQGVLFMMRS